MIASSITDSDSGSDESDDVDFGVDAGVDSLRDNDLVEAEPPITTLQHECQLGPHTEPEPLALPVELIFVIVELAATHRRTAISLCRVATWVRAAVLPSLYGTIVIHGSGPTPLDLVDEHDNNGAGEDYLKTGILESPLRHIRSLWLDVPPERAPRSLDACPRLRQLALPLEAHATICNTTRWFVHDDKTRRLSSSSLTKANFRNALELDVDIDNDGDIEMDELEADGEPCRSFTVLGQSHPHRWAPLTSSPNGRAFLRGVTHLRILNLCLSHYSTSSSAP